MKTTSILITLTFLFLAYLPGSAQRSTPGKYVKFDGIDGESVDKEHKNWCDLLSYSQSFSKPSSASGTSRRRGGVVVEDLVCVKELDKSSPKLQEAICKGKVFPKVELELVNTTGTYLRYELKNVMITNYSISGDNERPTEEFSINFEEIKVIYTEQKGGKTAGKVEYTWKVEEGMK